MYMSGLASPSRSAAMPLHRLRKAQGTDSSTFESVGLTGSVLDEAGVETDHIADLLECSCLDTKGLGRDEPVDTLAARGSGKGAGVTVHVVSWIKLGESGESVQ